MHGIHIGIENDCISDSYMADAATAVYNLQ